MSPTRRGQGIGWESVRFTLKALELSLVHQWLLRTWDAHGVYTGLGFTVMDHPEDRGCLIHKPREKGLYGCHRNGLREGK